MIRRVLVALVMLTLIVSPAHGQIFGPIPVIETANLVQTVLNAHRSK